MVKHSTIIELKERHQKEHLAIERISIELRLDQGYQSFGESNKSSASALGEGML